MEDKIIVMGKNDCQRTKHFLEFLKENNYEPKYMDLSDTANLPGQEFFADRCEVLGTPLIQMPDGTLSNNYADILEKIGIDPTGFDING